MSVFCRIDDKFIPLYRVLWIAATPHFCGAPDCVREGLHEVALDGGERIWATGLEQGDLVKQIEEWQDPDLDEP